MGGGGGGGGGNMLHVPFTLGTAHQKLILIQMFVHIRLIVLMYLNVRFLKVLQMNKTWWFNALSGHRLNYSTPVTLTKMLSFLSLLTASSTPLTPLFLQSLTRRRCCLLWLSKSLTPQSGHFLMLLHFYWSVCLLLNLSPSLSLTAGSWRPEGSVCQMVVAQAL